MRPSQSIWKEKRKKKAWLPHPLQEWSADLGACIGCRESVGTKNVSSLPRTTLSLSSGSPPRFLQVPKRPFCVCCLVSLPPLDGCVVETWPSKTFRLCFAQIPVPKSCAGPNCHHARVFGGRLSKYKNVPKKAERSAELSSGASQIVSDTL